MRSATHALLALLLALVALACDDTSGAGGGPDADRLDTGTPDQADGLSFPEVDAEPDAVTDGASDVPSGEDAAPDTVLDVSEDADCPITCGPTCEVVGSGGSCTCSCPPDVDCAELDYCDCRDHAACTAIVSGPTCGLDCECDGLACGCPSGIFEACVDASCPDLGDCPLETAECTVALGDDGCPVCHCEEPPGGCTLIDDYCACVTTPGCRPVTNGIDCGWDCECNPDIDCDCGGTELLACQSAACPAGFDEPCDEGVDGTPCEVVQGEDGCFECRCVGQDDVCQGLGFCGCLATEGCQPLTDTCLCPCDYACPGYEDCVCVCGGGDYLGCGATE